MSTIDIKVKSLIQRELIVFDFDETLVDCNSDTWVHQLAPEGRIPEALNYRQGQDYFKHVQSVLSYLHGELGIREQDYLDCLAKMPPVEGMLEELILKIGQLDGKPFDMIILSDSNSFFINSYLRQNHLEEYFPTVLTNQAKFNTAGQLIMNEFHVQDYCPLSARNLCKGEALKTYIGKRMLEHNTVYTCINYVGDGENDLCPSTKLGARDRIFSRAGYPLDKLCLSLKQQTGELARPSEGLAKLPELKASVISWETGEDIFKVIMGSSAVVAKVEGSGL